MIHIVTYAYCIKHILSYPNPNSLSSFITVLHRATNIPNKFRWEFSEHAPRRLFEYFLVCWKSRNIYRTRTLTHTRINCCRRQNAVMKKKFNVWSLLPYGKFKFSTRNGVNAQAQAKHRAICIWMRWQNPTYDAFAKRFCKSNFEKIQPNTIGRIINDGENWEETFEFKMPKKKIQIDSQQGIGNNNNFDLIKACFQVILTVQTTGNAFSVPGSVEWSRPKRMTAA